jgi:hypothetical protein
MRARDPRHEDTCAGVEQGHAQGRGKGREREGGSPWDPKSGDNRHRITPRARGEREVE